MAMRNIGRYYELGLGVPRDLTIARNWYEKAVQAGNMEAAYFLSGMYMEGRGVPVNLSEGLRLLKLAAGNGVPDAMNDYGVCFITGKGVPVNVQNAVYWYTKAADAGCAMAMKNLGATYFRDNRVQQDLDAAMHYFELATQNGLDCTPEIEQVRAQISQQPRKTDHDLVRVQNQPIFLFKEGFGKMFAGFFKAFQLTMDRYTVGSGQMGIKTCTFLGHLFPKKKQTNPQAHGGHKDSRCLSTADPGSCFAYIFALSSM